ncbi:3-phosphoshikimate 1-carboxyvinyltransferase [Buchnera aphidicola]|uniref:3-phosphoshikimate 1-carboxyvinyltransferase n=1 Tax=Buchnera aphidicola (Stegophylla sp.) TaxID=2315800 RepID=A0A4D6YB95_9GAMM|nr:3-phosphoshikimate 1-carboxyvinyltransferase [Buchnera aphidicola (Stegophylla sp.)]QCI26372.1 3-phosphoshikimate 1-carboxyvinyltransferase [Buchnera aphidicola (Stegophylla sp.)]
MNTKKLTLKPISSIYGEVCLPGSKSISNRVLLIASISYGKTNLKNLLDSDDIHYMLDALKTLGIQYHLSNNKKNCIIQGNPQVLYNHKTSLFLGNAGTAIRPLTGILSLHKNDITLTGDLRMQERPIHHLVDALIQGGACIQYLKKKKYPPIRILGGFQGGNITIQGNISSQFLTSILMVAPLAKRNTIISIKNHLVSKPYIDITINLMKSFGINIDNNNYKQFYIQGNQQYISPGNYWIEGDASSASYFLSAAAIKGKYIRVTGIGKNSIQGDIQFVDVLKNMGAKIYKGDNFIECYKGNLIGIDLDANHIPDCAMTIAILALFVYNNSITTIRNIYNWKVKETDRLYAMKTELRKVGAIVYTGKDFIRITPPKKFIHAHINTYNDHRIAMCFSLIALSNQPVTIINPQCVSKTFPKYFSELLKVSIYQS